MNNMYEILEKMNLLEGRGVKPDFPDIDRDGDRTEPISKAAREMDEAMPAPVVKTGSGFTARAPKGKQLQTTVPKDRPVSPADVKIKEQGDAYGHRGSPTFGHSHRMAPGYDPTFRSPIDSPAGSEIEELEYLMSKGAMTGSEEMRLRSLYNKFGIRRPEDMAKIPQLRQQELERIERTQAELQRRSAEANVASRDEMERQRAARAGVTARPGSDISTTAGFRKAFQDAGKRPANEAEDIQRPRHPQELDYQQGPEDDEQYRAHHGLDDPDRKRERRLRTTDYKTLDRLERQAVDRAKQIDEEPNEGNEFIKARLDAIKAGKPTFRLDGKIYRVTGDTSDEKTMNEGRNDPSPLDDPLTRFRKKHAPSVMRDPEGRKELSKLDTEYGERRKSGYGRGEDEDEDDEDSGKKKDKPAGEKRGRGRPKGSKRRIGAKGPTGRSKLMRMEEDYDRDEYDEEGEMAKSQARTIEDAAQELQDILDDDENLPEWVQKKITLAKEYIDSARDYMKANPDEEDMDVDVEVDDEDFMAEKAVSQAQRKAAGIAYAAKKGDIPKSELRGASKEMAKMAGGELKKFAKTKEKGLPEKVKEEDKDEVEETTVAGSVAVSDEAPKSKKGGMQFGKGVYESQIAESFERRLSMLTEGMNINMSVDENGRKSLTVSATDDDAAQLADILKMAGLGGERRMNTCEVCGGHEGMHEAGCGRRDMVEEELANSPDPSYAELGDTRDYGVSGGLNGPKLQANPNNMADNPLAMHRLASKGASGQLNLGAMAEDVEQRLENRLMDLYKRIS